MSKSLKLHLLGQGRFFKRNRLSLRKAHLKRRGLINEVEANNFGKVNVFNCDETSIRLHNVDDTTIAPIGVDEVTIETKGNLKECFTCIGTINTENSFPLFLISKGTTERSQKKFNIRNGDAVIVSSSSGWTTEEVMFQYLDYLKQITKGDPCALVLDQFKAHTTTKVKERAKQNGIQLIFVPQNATSLFQPLDRKVFGVLKQKLRFMAKDETFDEEKRYEIVTNYLIKAWGQISSKTIESAWKIHGLLSIDDLEDSEFEYYSTEEEEEGQN